MAILTGDGFGNTLTGTSGEDNFIDGQGGNDSLTGADQIDAIYGGSGFDTIDGLGGDDVLNGGADADTITGGAGADVFEIAFSDGLNDALFGGADADRVVNIGGFALTLGSAMLSWTGIETIDGAGFAIAVAAGQTVDFSTYTLLNVTQITGTGFTETIIGSAAADTILAGGGNDSLAGNGGADVITGTGANEVIDGGSENDTLSGGGGSDSIGGGAGDDLILAQTTQIVGTTINGGIGYDILRNAAPVAALTIGNTALITGIEEIDGDTAAIFVAGGGSVDFSAILLTDVPSIVGTGFTETIIGSAGSDTIFGGGGNDSIDGGLGNDRIEGANGFETVTGGSGADTITLFFGNDSVDAGTGNDVILIAGTEAVNDILKGGSGTDTLLNRAATDFTLGGAQMQIEGIEVLDGNNSFLNVAAGGSLNLSGIATVQRLTGIFGTGFGETITGWSGTDSIFGGGGNDVIDGGGGADILVTLSGADTILGGAGSDTITAGGGNDSIDAGVGNDIIRATGGEAFADTLVGGAGTDTLLATGGTDISIGSAFSATEVEVLDAAGFRIQIGGGASVDLSVFATLLNVVEIRGTGFGEAITGHSGGDTISGGGGNDVISGLGGQDVIVTGSGTDTVFGGFGNDTINGVGGNDSLDGGDGDDTFLISGAEGLRDVHSGGAGFDRILNAVAGSVTLGNGFSYAGVEAFDGNGQSVQVAAGESLDFSGFASVVGVTFINGTGFTETITGWSGADTIYSGGGLDVLSGFDGDDFLVGGTSGETIYGGLGLDTLQGQGGNDLLDGGDGDDTFQVSGAAGFADSIVGGAGNDTILNIAAGPLSFGTGFAASGIELIDGGGFAIDIGAGNTLDLSGIADATGVTGLFGTGFAEGVTGTGGADTFFAGGGTDTIGAAGDDAANDVIDGGTQVDVFRILGTGALILADGFAISGVEDFDGQGNAIRFTGGTLDLSSTAIVNVPSIAGSAGIDIILGGLRADTIRGDGGDDELSGGRGRDSLFGDLGNDTLFGGIGRDRLFGGDGDDNLRGALGDDVITGARGNDVLRGEDGNDVLTGGAGGDASSGGAGNDSFVFNAATDSQAGVGLTDTIRDLVVGEDTIDLSAIDAIAGGADDAFTFIGIAALSGAAGELALRQIGGAAGTDWYLEGEIDGLAGVDLRIRLDALGAGTLFGDAEILN